MAILVFAVLSGAGVSTKRAVLMFLLLLLGGVIGRSYDSLTGLALAAIFYYGKIRLSMPIQDLSFHS